MISVVASPIKGNSETMKVAFPDLLYNIDHHFVESFTHNYGINHFIAASSSLGIVKSGVDWRFHSFSRDNPEIGYAGFSSVMVGGLTPLLLPVGLFYYGNSKDNEELKLTSMALGQAAILGFVTSSLYKAFTGRRAPEILDEKTDDPDFSDDFKFGFLNRGVFNGWPSGHATIATAMAATLYELYPGNRSVKVGSILYATFIGLGVATNIHWLSDSIAGVLIGYTIGKSVGSGFNKLRNSDNSNMNFHINITPSGLGFSYYF